MNSRLPALAVLLLLAACGRSAPLTEPPLAGARIGGPFALTDQEGRVRRDSDFAGRYRIMYFGYTFCPDVCPVDAGNIARGLRSFEQRDAGRAAKVVPVFVTVDPARDTPAVLKQFVASFHSRFVGLTGTQAQIDAVTKAFATYVERGEVQPGGGYLVDHMRVTYLMGPDGAPIALLPADEGADAVTAALDQWVK